MSVNPAALDLPMFTALKLGARVDRAAAALPQTAAGSLFTVTGGRVLLLAIVGEVTTVIQTQANASKLQSVPTVGSTVDMCTTLDITADEVGCLYGITGIPADALVGANAGLGCILQHWRRQVVPVVPAPGRWRVRHRGLIRTPDHLTRLEIPPCPPTSYPRKSS